MIFTSGGARPTLRPNTPLPTCLHAKTTPSLRAASAAPASDTRSAAPEADVVRSDATGGPSDEELVELGVFGAAHGVRGELKLQPITEDVEGRMSDDTRKWARRQSGRRRQPLRELCIEGVRGTVSKGREAWLVKVKGVDSIEDAQLLQGQTLLMLAAERPALDSGDEFYVQELIGMQVVMHSDKSHVGKVVDVFSGTGSHDLLKVELELASDGEAPEAEAEPARSAFVPFVAEIVPFVDRGQRRLEIDPPEGLLDLKALLKASSSTKPPSKRSRRRKPQQAPSESLEQTNA